MKTYSSQPFKVLFPSGPNFFLFSVLALILFSPSGFAHTHGTVKSKFLLFTSAPTFGIEFETTSKQGSGELDTLPLNSPSPSTEKTAWEKGVLEYKARRYSVAFAHLKDAVQNVPTDTAAWRLLAEVSLEIRKYEEAIAAFEQLYAYRKDDLQLVKTLAELNYNWKRNTKAKFYADQWQSMEPDGMAWKILSGIFLQEENYGAVVQLLEQQLAKGNKDPQLFYQLGKTYVELSNYKKAVGFYEEAINRDTTQSRWVYELAMVCFAVPDDAKAVAYFELAALRGYPKSNDYLENLGMAYLNSKKPEKGIAILQDLLKRKPGDIQLLNVVAEACYRSERFQEAIDTWDQVMLHDPKNAKALYMIGMSYQKKGDKAKGVQLCDQAIALDPTLKNLKQEKKIM